MCAVHQAEQAVEDVASLYEQVSILGNEGFDTVRLLFGSHRVGNWLCQSVSE